VVRIAVGAPRGATIGVSVAATLTPVSDRSAISASDSRVNTSMTVNVRNQRPSAARQPFPRFRAHRQAFIA
jgi:hypothetical protein